VKIFKDIEEVNSAGYLTVEQTNEKLKNLGSSLRARLGSDDYYTELQLIRNLFLIFKRHVGVIMPGDQSRGVFLKAIQVKIDNLDFKNYIFVFDEEKIIELGNQNQLIDAPARTAFELGD
jgi:hypothetical protein